MASEHDRKEYHEGQEAARRFEDAMHRILTVSKEELARREAAYQVLLPDVPRGTLLSLPALVKVAYPT